VKFVGFLLLWVWCCLSCFLLRALGDRFSSTSISGVRMCERVRTCARTRDTRTGCGHHGHHGHKHTSKVQKPRPYAPKTGIYIYFYLFLFNGHQRSPRSHTTPPNTSSSSTQVLSLCSQRTTETISFTRCQYKRS